jgi:hypothetical protein
VKQKDISDRGFQEPPPLLTLKESGMRRKKKALHASARMKGCTLLT